jgi:hypothetical protein
MFQLWIDFAGLQNRGQGGGGGGRVVACEGGGVRGKVEKGLCTRLTEHI